MKQDVIYSFLKTVSPLNLLDEETLRQLAAEVEIKEIPKGQHLYTQAKSPVHHLHIIRKGSVKLMDERSQELYDLLTEGEHFGGVAMLLKDSRAFRSSYTQEDTVFYLLPEEKFLGLCEKHPLCSQYFVNTLSVALMEKSKRQRTQGIEVPDIRLFAQTMDSLSKAMPVFCAADLSIRDAAEMMTEKGVDYLLVCHEKEKPVGIVTDIDMRKKVVREGRDIEEPIKNIMNAPLNTISHNTVEMEGLMSMLVDGIHHLIVTKNGKVSGVVTHDDFIANQGFSPVALGKNIERAKVPQDLRQVFKKIPSVVQGLIKGGLHAESISKVLSALNDKIMEKVVQLAEDVMETPPPVAYCFVVMGSEGRQEQTFKTDQDNALIRAESPAGLEAEVDAWFAAFAEKVCIWLDEIGFPLCKGDIMAKNPKWNQPLSQWKNYFSQWIIRPKGEEILNSAIFFDFRAVYGDFSLAEELQDHLFERLKTAGNLFFVHFAKACGLRHTPLSFFRNFVVEKNGEHKSKLDLKHNGSSIIVDIARIFAMRHGVRETNTVDRIKGVRAIGGRILQDSTDLSEAYQFLMTLRLNHQIQQICDGQEPDNYVNPSKLSLIEKKVLKEAFQFISHFQDKTIEKYSPGGLG